MYSVSFRIAQDDPRLVVGPRRYRTLDGALFFAKTKILCADVRIYDDEREVEFDRAQVIERLKKTPDPLPEMPIEPMGWLKPN